MAKTAQKPATAKTGKTAPAAQPAAPTAPLYVVGPWPVKSQTGNSIRAYCYKVAVGLQKANAGGFTLAQYASALAANASGSNMRQPSTGWGTAQKPNGAAMAHANYFANAKQGWLAPAPAAK